MNKAREQFFSAMNQELEPHEADRCDLDIDFSVTESGRTVAHMVQCRSPGQDMQYSITTSERTVNSDDDDLERDSMDHFRDGFGSPTKVVSKSIPVPKQPPKATSSVPQPAQSQASSQGSSGSAFLSSVLNPAASTFGSTQLSHTPPAASSYEVSHFGKRPRSGSVSGRLRSASEYLEDKGLLDRTTRGILKDLIIIGDEDLQQALDRYEAGDPSSLEQMISSGALQERLPQDLDILGDLDMDFLTVQDGAAVGDLASGNIEPLQGDVSGIPAFKSESIPIQTGSSDVQKRAPMDQPNMVSPQYDGIGDLDFAPGDFAEEAGDEYSNFQPDSFGSSSKQVSAATSPSDQLENMSEHEKRMRSNSLFSALLDPRLAPAPQPQVDDHADSMRQYGQWMDRTMAADALHTGIKVEAAAKSAAMEDGRRKRAGGLAASLEAEKKKQERKLKKEQKAKDRQEKKDKRAKEKKKGSMDDDDMLHEHVPGSGTPRSLNDPNLQTSYDKHGLMNVERPDGWVGAYSPDSRKVRIEKFLSKRNNRVWTKTVKYDVRKNFADSRLRVKGRFVKKGDELLMRELMSLT